MDLALDQPLLLELGEQVQQPWAVVAVAGELVAELGRGDQQSAASDAGEDLPLRLAGVGCRPVGSGGSCDSAHRRGSRSGGAVMVRTVAPQSGQVRR